MRFLRSLGLRARLILLPRVAFEEVWVNLLSNAIKFSGTRDVPAVSVTVAEHAVVGVSKRTTT